MPLFNGSTYFSRTYQEVALKLRIYDADFDSMLCTKLFHQLNGAAPVKTEREIIS